MGKILSRASLCRQYKHPFSAAAQPPWQSALVAVCLDGRLSPWRPADCPLRDPDVPDSTRTGGRVQPNVPVRLCDTPAYAHHACAHGPPLLEWCIFSRLSAGMRTKCIMPLRDGAFPARSRLLMAGIRCVGGQPQVAQRRGQPDGCPVPSLFPPCLLADAAEHAKNQEDQYKEQHERPAAAATEASHGGTLLSKYAATYYVDMHDGVTWVPKPFIRE